MQQFTSNLHTLPNQGYIRVSQLLQFIPVSRSTWWLWVKEGKAPAPIKLGPKITAWRVQEVHEFINRLSSDNNEAT